MMPSRESISTVAAAAFQNEGNAAEGPRESATSARLMLAREQGEGHGLGTFFDPCWIIEQLLMADPIVNGTADQQTAWYRLQVLFEGPGREIFRRCAINFLEKLKGGIFLGKTSASWLFRRIARNIAQWFPIDAYVVVEELKEPPGPIGDRKVLGDIENALLLLLVLIDQIIGEATSAITAALSEPGAVTEFSKKHTEWELLCMNCAETSLRLTQLLRLQKTLGKDLTAKVKRVRDRIAELCLFVEDCGAPDETLINALKSLKEDFQKLDARVGR